MNATTSQQALEALRAIVDPDLHQDIVSLGFVKTCEVDQGRVRAIIELTTPACPVKDQMREQARQILSELPGITEVEVEMTAQVRGGRSEAPREIATGVHHIVAISSGKGGVGKSTVTVNLALALARTGAKVGILDCDVYGPDIPMMVGISGAPEVNGQSFVPPERNGVKTMSLGYLLEDDQPVVWRGPMIHSLIQQFLADVDWGELDYLLVDMPPGTGDAQLSLAQTVPLSGAVVVTTPQAVATFDVTKAIGMFEQVNVPILGIVENMSGLVIKGRVAGGAAGTKISVGAEGAMQEAELAEDGSFETVMHLFGAGGADRLAERHGAPVLGRIPLNPSIRAGGDSGDPIVATDPEGIVGREFSAVAGRFAQRIAIQEHRELPVLS